MWKIFVGFIAFALLALFIIMKGGDKVDMQGESAGHAPAEHGSTSAPATGASAPGASAPGASAAMPNASSAPAGVPAGAIK